MKLASYLLLLLTLYLSVQLFLAKKDNNNLKSQLTLQIDFNQDQLLRCNQDCEMKLSELRGYISFLGVNNQGADNQSTMVCDEKTAVGNNFEKQKRKQLLHTVNLKYDILLHELDLPYDLNEKLLSLLLMREEMSTAGVFPTANQSEVDELINDQKQSLAEVDFSVHSLLNENQKIMYDLLKDSTYEKFQLNRFLIEVDAESLISQQDRRFLIIEKLKSRKAFFDNLDVLSKDISSSQGDTRTILIDQVRNAVHGYKDAYLLSARTILNDQQFSALREIEQNSANEMLDSLLAGWGEKTLSD